MQLPTDAVIEFQTLYESEFGEQISEDEARIISTNLIDLYQFVTEKKS